MYGQKLMAGTDKCEPCKPKKAPVFNLGDVVQSTDGDVFKIAIIWIRYGEVVYSSQPHYDAKIEHLKFHSGHSLKKYTGKK
jgi:hypothetical protein